MPSQVSTGVKIRRLFLHQSAKEIRRPTLEILPEIIYVCKGARPNKVNIENV